MVSPQSRKMTLVERGIDNPYQIDAYEWQNILNTTLCGMPFSPRAWMQDCNYNIIQGNFMELKSCFRREGDDRTARTSSRLISNRHSRKMLIEFLRRELVQPLPRLWKESLVAQFSPNIIIVLESPRKSLKETTLDKCRTRFLSCSRCSTAQL